MSAPTFRTIIEPFRIHSGERLRMTTSQQRREAVVRVGYNEPAALGHFTATFEPLG